MVATRDDHLSFCSPPSASSRAIHSRMNAGQFRRLTPASSHAPKNLTASRSASLTSFRSTTVRWLGRWSSINSFSCAMWLASIRPLRMSTVHPGSTDVSIFSVTRTRLHPPRSRRAAPRRREATHRASPKRGRQNGRHAERPKYADLPWARLARTCEFATFCEVRR